MSSTSEQKDSQTDAGGDQMSRSDIDGPKYLEDDVLDDINEDTFDHEAYVNVLEAVVHNNGPSWHIGLFGTWGSGKSSIVNLLFDRIRADRDARADDETSTLKAESELNDDKPDEKRNTAQASVSTSEPEVQQALSEDEKSESSSQSASEDARSPEGEVKEINHTRYNFSNTACVKIDAWKHNRESIRTGIILDLNEKLAAEVTGKSQFSLPSRHPLVNHPRWQQKLPTLPLLNPSSPAETILETDEILNELHDVTEETDLDSIWSWLKLSLKELSIQIVLIGAIAILLGLLYVFLTQIREIPVPSLNGIAGTSGSGESSILGISLLTVLVTAVVSTIVKRALDTKSALSRTQINPRREWAGAYNQLFDQIIKKAKKEYEASYDEELEHIIISVDDLDRCESETVYNTLIALKSFLENDSCTYIIPCDDDALYQHLRAADKGEYLSNVSNPRDFLAKFFETQIRITRPDSNQLEEFANSKLEEIEIDIPKSVVADVLLQADLQTPRRIIQAINRTLSYRALVQERDVEGINPHSETDLKFLAKIAIIQEDYPEFHTALLEGDLSLGNLVDPVATDAEATSIAALRGELSEAGVPDGQRRDLAEFLLDTRSIYQPPDPYLQLLGDEVDEKEQFVRALYQGRHNELQRLVKEADRESNSTTQQELKTILLENIREKATNQDPESIRPEDAFAAAVEIHDSFRASIRDELSEDLYKILDSPSMDRIQLLDAIEPNSLEILLKTESADEQRVTELVRWGIQSAISQSEVDEGNLEEILEIVKQHEQELISSDLSKMRQIFANRVDAAVTNGVLTRRRHRQLVNKVASSYRPLYSEQLVEGLDTHQ